MTEPHVPDLPSARDTTPVRHELGERVDAAPLSVPPDRRAHGQGFSWSAPATGGLPMLVTPAAPFALPSLDHLELLVERAVSKALTVEGLRASTTSRWVIAYHALRRYLLSLSRGDAFLGGDVRVQRRILEDWIAWMRAANLSRNSIATYWRGVGALLGRIGRDSEMLNPCLLVPAPKENLPHPSYLTRERAESLLRYLANRQEPSAFETSRDLCLVGLMVLAGLRRQETLNLLVGDVNVQERTLHIRAGKGRHGGRDRTAYMTPQLQTLVRTYLVTRRKYRRTHPELLSSVHGNRPMGLTALRRLFARASHALGAKVTPHQLRHSYATFLRQAGVADRVAMELLGHRSPAMLYRYSHVLDAEPAREATRLRLEIDL